MTIVTISNSMGFGFEIMVDFAMDIDKINLANLVGKLMDEIKVYRKIKAKLLILSISVFI